MPAIAARRARREPERRPGIFDLFFGLPKPRPETNLGRIASSRRLPTAPLTATRWRYRQPPKAPKALKRQSPHYPQIRKPSLMQGMFNFVIETIVGGKPHEKKLNSMVLAEKERKNRRDVFHHNTIALTPGRKRNLDKLTGRTVKLIRAVASRPETRSSEREKLLDIARGIVQTPIMIYPGRKVLFGDNHSVVHGENVTSYETFQSPIGKVVRQKNVILLPEGIFSGDAFNAKGIFTWMHEQGHRIGGEDTADAFAARMCLEAGFSRRTVLRQLEGRDGIYSPRALNRIRNFVLNYRTPAQREKYRHKMKPTKSMRDRLFGKYPRK